MSYNNNINNIIDEYYLLLKVRLVSAVLAMVKALGQSGLMMSSALEMRAGCWIAHLEHLEAITVVMVKMLV